jgi:hypothetical protein
MKTYHDFKKQINQDILDATKEVLINMAWVETVKPIVLGYQREILANHQFRVIEKYRDGSINEVILEPDRSYLMSDTDFAVYLAECNQARINAGLKVDNDEYCPLLVAEDNLRKARRKLIDLMEPVTSVKFDMLFNTYPDNYNKYLDLILKLVVPMAEVLP